jgi:hypothetical protein
MLTDSNRPMASENHQHPQTEDPGEAGFSTLVLMLGTAAMVHLGAAPDPVSGEEKPDLGQAKQMIDLLDVLKAKTAGNLTVGESSVLDDLLFDLRMRYLEAVNQA